MPYTGHPEIQQAGFERVRSWRRKAAAERVSLEDTPTTRWFVHDGVACAGLMSIVMRSFRGARIRAVFVDRAFRGLGIGTALTEHLIAVAADEGYEFVEAFAWNPRWYIARGFMVIGQNSHGATWLRKKLAA